MCIGFIFSESFHSMDEGSARPLTYTHTHIPIRIGLGAAFAVFKTAWPPELVRVISPTSLNETHSSLYFGYQWIQWILWRTYSLVSEGLTQSLLISVNQMLISDIYEFEVIKAVSMQSSIFWNIMSCSAVKANQSFGVTYRHHVQNKPSKKTEWCRQ
jgi:hypothetical protein